MNSLSTQRDDKSRFFSGFEALFQAAILAVLVGGCAAVAPKAPEDVVKQLSQARWEALLKGDTKTAYGYLSPGSRAVLKEADYDASIRKDFWKAARVDKVDCERGERCEVQLTIEYEFQRMRTKTPLRETWIREGSDWWYVHR